MSVGTRGNGGKAYVTPIRAIRARRRYGRMRPAAPGFALAVADAFKAVRGLTETHYYSVMRILPCCIRELPFECGQGPYVLQR